MAKKRPAKRRAAARPKKTSSQASAARLVSVVKKKVKGSAIQTLDKSEALANVTEFIPSGFADLDEILGGGWAVGRASEVFGDEGCGKSAAAHMAIKGVQAVGGIAVLLDYEAALDETKLMQMGIDPERLIYEIPDHIEQGWDIIWAIMDDLKKNVPDAPILIVWDSIGGAIPKAELEEKSADKAHVGLVARAMSKGCRRMFKAIARVRAHMMWISQERVAIGKFSPFGPVQETSGGKSPKYAASQRVRLARVKTIKRSLKGNKSRATGYLIKAITKKNRITAPEQHMEWVIDFTVGPSPELSILMTLLDVGAVRSVKGGNYAMRGWPKVKFKRAEWREKMEDPDFRAHAEGLSMEVTRAGGVLAVKAAEEDEDEED